MQNEIEQLDQITAQHRMVLDNLLARQGGYCYAIAAGCHGEQRANISSPPLLLEQPLSLRSPGSLLGDQAGWLPPTSLTAKGSLEQRKAKQKQSQQARPRVPEPIASPFRLSQPGARPRTTRADGARTLAQEPAYPPTYPSSRPLIALA
ncbi:neuronal cell adhesion molecule NRCAM transcript variant X4 mRNA [Crotalus adamanteus]|uniref:Neuronal cell adhesion molecule NRCAM transcript variant X4 mRNA n=1 Tax=Crotalus adamanteus TaxID=8729 RepID=A0AAW1BD83_CROAD